MHGLLKKRNLLDILIFVYDALIIIISNDLKYYYLSGDSWLTIYKSPHKILELTPRFG